MGLKFFCLRRTVAELSQEVADIVEERVVLEYQLEQLKSFGNQVINYQSINYCWGGAGVSRVSAGTAQVI
jgi:hypothetical protein